MFRLLGRQPRARVEGAGLRGQGSAPAGCTVAADPCPAPAASPPFVFVDVPRLLTLVDGELELVEPVEGYVDGLLAACHHPLTKKLMAVQARTTRENLLTFLSQNPRGRATPDAAHGIAPGYTFWMRVEGNETANGRNGETASSPALADSPIRPLADSSFTLAGSISLRLGHNANLDFYLGHIGYHVLPPSRGHRFAERACRLLLPLARAHGHTHLWITCNPDNAGSRKTCERLGARLVEIVAVPRDNPLYSQGDRQKCRYRLDV